MVQKKSKDWCDLGTKMSSNKKAAKAEEVDSDEEQVVEEEESPEEAGEDTSLANPEVLIKYQEAAKIVNLVLAEVASLVS